MAAVAKQDAGKILRALNAQPDAKDAELHLFDAEGKPQKAKVMVNMAASYPDNHKREDKPMDQGPIGGPGIPKPSKQPRADFQFNNMNRDTYNALPWLVNFPLLVTLGACRQARF